MKYETIIVEVADHVATVTLNRPDKLNAFNQQMCDEFEHLWNAIRLDDDVRVIVLQANSLILDRTQIAIAAAATRLPTVFGYREHAETGGLISYGVNLEDCFRRAASYVHNILKGTSVADLPIEFPTKLELIVNLRTAKTLGLTVPPTLLARADEVIE